MFKKVLAVVTLMVGLVVGMVGTAHAALDPSVSLGLTAVKTDFTALLALVYPIMIAITSALVIFGLVKMFIRKAAGK